MRWFALTQRTDEQWRRQVLQVEGADIWGPVDGGTDGPERGAEARSAGAPRGWGLGRGAVAPPQYGDLGAMPQKMFQKNQHENRVFFGIFTSALA